MKKLLFIFIICIWFTACNTNNSGNTSSSDVLDTTMSESNAETTNPKTIVEPSVSEELKTELSEITNNDETFTDLYFIEFTDEAAGEEYFPALRLSENGSFMLLVNLYDSMGKVYGIYEIDDDIYTFNVTEKNFNGYVGDNTNTFTMKLSKNTLTYSGDSIGATENGSVFNRSDEIPVSYTRALTYPKRYLNISKYMTVIEAAYFLSGNLSAGMSADEIETLTGAAPVKVYAGLDGREMLRYDILTINGYSFENVDKTAEVDFKGLKEQEVTVILFIYLDDNNNLESYAFYYYTENHIYENRGNGINFEDNLIRIVS